MGATFRRILVNTLSIHTRICGAGRVIVAVCGIVTTSIDGRIVTYVVCSALIFGTWVSIVAICNDQATVLLVWILTVTSI